MPRGEPMLDHAQTGTLHCALSCAHTAGQQCVMHGAPRHSNIEETPPSSSVVLDMDSAIRPPRLMCS